MIQLTVDSARNIDPSRVGIPSTDSFVCRHCSRERAEQYLDQQEHHALAANMEQQFRPFDVDASNCVLHPKHRIVFEALGLDVEAHPEYLPRLSRTSTIMMGISPDSRENLPEKFIAKAKLNKIWAILYPRSTTEPWVEKPPHPRFAEVWRKIHDRRQRSPLPQLK